MPRTGRQCPGGLIYHVLNRGNDRQTIFHKQGDARAFINLLAEAKQRVPIRLLAWCLMRNHWHLVLWPHGDGDVSAFMAWLSNAHVRRYRQHYENIGTGHLYQGRFKSFAVKDDDHLLYVLRYVEANPLRAGIVKRAEDWQWSSLSHWRSAGPSPMLDAGPIDRPADWLSLVNTPMPEKDLAPLRTSVIRSRPFGPDEWVQRIAAELGLDFTLRSRGRPRKGDIQNIPPGSPTEAVE